MFYNFIFTVSEIIFTHFNFLYCTFNAQNPNHTSYHIRQTHFVFLIQLEKWFCKNDFVAIDRYRDDIICESSFMQQLFSYTPELLQITFRYRNQFRSNEIVIYVF